MSPIEVGNIVMAMDERSHDVFVSYSSGDKAVADGVCHGLEQSGFRCWIAPRDILPGRMFESAVMEAIGECRMMVLVLSTNANESPHVAAEVKRAFEKGLTVIPFRIDNVAPAVGLQYYIGSVHWLDALPPPFSAHIVRLIESVRVNLKGEIRPADGPRAKIPATEAFRLLVAADGCATFQGAKALLDRISTNDYDDPDLVTCIGHDKDLVDFCIGAGIPRDAERHIYSFFGMLRAVNIPTLIHHIFREGPLKTLGAALEIRRQIKHYPELMRRLSRKYGSALRR